VENHISIFGFRPEPFHSPVTAPQVWEVKMDMATISAQP
jgi:hypothetical protein